MRDLGFGSVRVIQSEKKYKKDDYEVTNRLVGRAIEGDKDALEELCDSISKGVFYRVRYGLDNPEDAEDISQEVLLCVCRKIRTLRAPEAFRTWLGKIILNETSNFRRKRSNRENILNIEDYSEILKDEREELVPSDYIENEETRKAIIQAISKLPARQRHSVLFYYYDGMSIKEIADSMGLAYTSVSTHLIRARAAIGAELKKKPHYGFYKTRVVYLGALLSDALNEDILSYNLPDANWISNALEQCREIISAGAAAAAGGATAAAGAGAAAGAYSSKAASAATVKTSTGVIAVVCASVVAAAAIGAGIFYDVKDSQELPAVKQAQIEGSIVFSGGNDYGENIVYVNPKNAVPQADGTGGEVKALSWWIVRKGNEAALYRGDGYTVDDTLVHMIDSGSSGEYILYFRLEYESGTVQRIGSNFYIMQ